MGRLEGKFFSVTMLREAYCYLQRRYMYKVGILHNTKGDNQEILSFIFWRLCLKLSYYCRTNDKRSGFVYFKSMKVYMKKFFFWNNESFRSLIISQKISDIKNRFCFYLQTYCICKLIFKLCSTYQ